MEKMSNNSPTNTISMKKHFVILLVMAMTMLGSNSYGQLAAIGKTFWRVLPKTAEKTTVNEVARKGASEEVQKVFKRSEIKKLEKELAEKEGTAVAKTVSGNFGEGALKNEMEGIGKKMELPRGGTKIHMADPEKTSKAVKENMRGAAEKSAKQSVKKGRDAIKELDDMPNMKKSVEDLQKKSPDYFKTGYCPKKCV